MPNKLLTCLAVLLLAAACSSGSSSSRQSVRCESDGGYRECDAGSAATVTLARQISDAACVEGLSWGVRDGKVWVDRGCRADFALIEGAAGGNLATAGTLVCESQDERLRRCPAITHGGVRLVRQLSDRACELGRTWGYDGSGIWVSEGCRAEFAVGGATGSADKVALVCESILGRRNHCPADTRFGVELVRQLSDAACVRNRTWGEDRDGVWVDQGCRAEFAVWTR
ncbi:MAG TPA: DUF3011 domain-containing protein [Thermoanaerobaculia bacterium]|nr:DUF3011 domain-containing protein [Thermoanaerobaculia bacterium]